MTFHAADRAPRRIRAVLVGVGLDGSDEPQRILSSSQCLVVGGSEETQADLRETILRLESELERLGRDLGELTPRELADVAWRIDLPELQTIAVRLDHGLEDLGKAFHETTADELTELACGDASL